MGKYDTSKLRNLGIVAHNSAGKTSLVEAILFNTGMNDKLGKVENGTSSMDFEEEEIKRKSTLSASLNHCVWNDYSLHIVDTPGVSNFLHDTRRCLRVLGGGRGDCVRDFRDQGPNQANLVVVRRVRGSQNRFCQQDGS